VVCGGGGGVGGGKRGSFVLQVFLILELTWVGRRLADQVNGVGQCRPV
jgi:hypothetical protein